MCENFFAQVYAIKMKDEQIRMNKKLLYKH